MDDQPVRVVLDQPLRRSVLRLRGRFSSVVGGFLVVLGSVAVVAAAAYTVVWLVNIESTPKYFGRLVVVWIGAVLLGWLGKGGLHTLRGNRRLVLFLRRFGHAEATDAVSFACRTIGRRWRLVTLDDAAIAPVGMAPVVGRTAGALQRRRDRLRKLGTKLFWAGQIALYVCLAVIGLIFVIVPDANEVSELSFPPRSFVGVVFWLFLAVFIALHVAAALAVAGALVLMPFRDLNPLLDAVVKADKSATGRVRTPAEIDAAATMVASQAADVLSPKLIVLTVDSAIWQQTVRRLASTAAVVLVDVSRPTEHLLWEISELGSGCVFVGHLDRLRRYTGGHGVEILAAAPDSVRARLDRHLAGQEVLAYTTDSAGLARFARALHARLEGAGGRR